VHSSRQLLREAFVQAFTRQLQPHLGHPYSPFFFFGFYHSIQCPDHIPAEARPSVCFDVVRKRARGCGCNHHHDSCNPYRVFAPPSYGRSYLPHRHCGESAGQAAAAAASYPSRSHSLILGIAQFLISIGATLLFGIMPSGRMFGDWVVSKSRKYLASQAFTASYPTLRSQARLGGVFLWFLVFGCKFTESYVYSKALATSDPEVRYKPEVCFIRFPRALI
jgi:hypothetical protein